MENIFKNAMFGDCFKTRGGMKAIYFENNTLLIENFGLKSYFSNGKDVNEPYHDTIYDIVTLKSEIKIEKN